MKTKTKFTIFHSLVITFYVYMFLTAVYRVDYEFGLITHRQFGIFISALIAIVFIAFFKPLTKKFKHYFNLKKGNMPMKIFKVSVILMMVHFILSVVSGLLMVVGYQTYDFHALSRYIVPAIVIFHLTSNIYRKFKLGRR